MQVSHLNCRSSWRVTASRIDDTALPQVGSVSYAFSVQRTGHAASCQEETGSRKRGPVSFHLYPGTPVSEDKQLFTFHDAFSTGEDFEFEEDAPAQTPTVHSVDIEAVDVVAANLLPPDPREKERRHDTVHPKQRDQFWMYRDQIYWQAQHAIWLFGRTDLGQTWLTDRGWRFPTISPWEGGVALRTAYDAAKATGAAARRDFQVQHSMSVAEANRHLSWLESLNRCTLSLLANTPDAVRHATVLVLAEEILSASEQAICLNLDRKLAELDHDSGPDEHDRYAAAKRYFSA